MKFSFVDMGGQGYRTTFLFVFCFSLGYAQENSNGDSTIVLRGIQMHGGIILAHSKAIADLADSRVSGIHADVSRIRLTQASWNTCNCYSQNGLSLSYFSFNNRAELGQAVSASLFVEPQLTYGRVNLGLRASAGVSYLTRVFHPQQNPRNLFFSNPWSGLLSMQLSGRFKVTRQWLIRSGISYQHISNGGQRQPNKGMNFPTLVAGIEYTQRYQEMQRRNRSQLEDRSSRFYAQVSYNTRSVDDSDFNSRVRKPVIGLHGGFFKPFASMHAVGLGFELMFDNALKEQSRVNDEIGDHRVISGLVQHHFIFGRFDFSQAVGIYFWKQYPTPDPVFQRYVIQYCIFDHVTLGLSLKAHLDTAEQMDIRVGMLF